MKTHLLPLSAVAFVVLSASACANTNGAAEAANGDCSPDAPLSGQEQFGNGGEGASCEKASDCAATCCTCTSGKKYLASECVNGSCAAGAHACDDEERLFSSQGYSLCQ
jgi:hypothetical protein